MTPVQLKTAALRKLRVISPDMPVSVEDMNVVTEKYAGLHAQLAGEHLVTWTITENVPTAVEQPMVSLLAASCLSEFTVPEQRVRQIMAEGGLQMPEMSLGERQLRKAINGKYIHSTLRTDYF